MRKMLLALSLVWPSFVLVGQPHSVGHFSFEAPPWGRALREVKEMLPGRNLRTVPPDTFKNPWASALPHDRYEYSDTLFGVPLIVELGFNKQGENVVLEMISLRFDSRLNQPASELENLIGKLYEGVKQKYGEPQSESTVPFGGTATFWKVETAFIGMMRFSVRGRPALSVTFQPPP
jgi:hypothetical protein